MAAKKYYAVKKGKSVGVFSTWEECKAAVEGYSGAEYKGFATRLEAEQYLGLWQNTASGHAEVAGTQAGCAQAAAAQFDDMQESDNVNHKGRLLAYVDGSYDDSLKKYAFGCVFILEDGTIYTECGNGDTPQSLQHRNVTGEMLGAMYAVKTAMLNGFSSLEICYDYQGLEKWVTGEWRTKTELTSKYAAAMREWSRNITLIFTKVAAHTNVKFNELADKTAKRGLTEANGVPKVRKLEELDKYIEAEWSRNGTDSIK